MTLIEELDYGTPARAGAPVTLEINGRPVTVPAGTSVMRAAVDAGVNVPRLCATDGLEPFGSCRMCLVEIDGRRGTPASCTTPVEPEMKVTTQSPKLAKLRRGVMELYMSDHPLDCAAGGTGECELHDLAAEVDLYEVRYGQSGANGINGRHRLRKCIDHFRRLALHLPRHGPHCKARHARYARAQLESDSVLPAHPLRCAMHVEGPNAAHHSRARHALR